MTLDELLDAYADGRIDEEDLEGAARRVYSATGRRLYATDPDDRHPALLDAHEAAEKPLREERHERENERLREHDTGLADFSDT